MRTVEQRLAFIEYRLLELSSLIAEILGSGPEELEQLYPTRFERAIGIINNIEANIKRDITFDDEE